LNRPKYRWARDKVPITIRSDHSKYSQPLKFLFDVPAITKNMMVLLMDFYKGFRLLKDPAGREHPWR